MKTKQINKLLALCLTLIMVSAFVMPTRAFAAGGDYVTVSVIPFRSYGIFGRKDYPAVKVRITLSGAIEGNRNDMVNGSSMTFKVRKTNAGQVHLVMCEVIYGNGARMLFTRRVWIDKHTNHLYVDAQAPYK